MRPNGNLFICERIPDGPPVKSGKGGRMREYDWDGNVVWEHIDDHQHHDGRRLENGNAVYIAWHEFNAEEIKQVKGGEPNTDKDSLIFIKYFVSNENKNFVYSTKLKINPKDWSKENRLPRLKRGGDSYKLRRITDELIKLNDKLHKAIDNHGKELTIGHLKEHFSKKKINLIKLLKRKTEKSWMKNLVAKKKSL